MTDELITSGKVASRLGVSDDTIRRWADSGHLPSYRMPSGHRRFLHSEVERFRARLLANHFGRPDLVEDEDY